MENNYLNNRIEALEAELRRVNSMKSKLTKNALRINEELKDFKETSKIALNTLTEIIADKDNELKVTANMHNIVKAKLTKDNYKSHKKMLKYKWESEMREGKFISSQRVVRELRINLAETQEDLRISKCHVENREEQMKWTEKALDLYKEKARLAREDAEYWAAESAKFEINCNNCNL